MPRKGHSGNLFFPSEILIINCGRGECLRTTACLKCMVGVGKGLLPEKYVSSTNLLFMLVKFHGDHKIHKVEMILATHSFHDIIGFKTVMYVCQFCYLTIESTSNIATTIIVILLLPPALPLHFPLCRSLCSYCCLYVLLMCAGHVDTLRGQHVVGVCCGSWHSVALSDANEIFTWGSNSHGQLGRSNVTKELRKLPRYVMCTDM